MELSVGTIRGGAPGGDGGRGRGPFLIEYRPDLTADDDDGSGNDDDGNNNDYDDVGNNYDDNGRRMKWRLTSAIQWGAGGQKGERKKGKKGGE
jgi:hypothetical protein